MSPEIELEVGAGAASGEFTIRVVRAASGGEPSATTRLDVDVLLRDRDALEAMVVASGVSGRGLSHAEEQLRRVGTQLFDALFSGPVLGTYRASKGVASREGGPLRVVLRLTVPQLAALPWEAMFDSETETYICRREQLVRHVAAPYTPEPLEVVPPLRVLGLVASPRGLPTLDVSAEQQRLSEALSGPIAAGLIQLDWILQATWEAVQEKLLSGAWHVLHFIGHGDYDPTTDQGLIALVGADGRAYRVEATRLADLLNEARPTPRLVVLNSCSSGEEGSRDLFSGTAATLVRSGISAVAAMQFTVSDPAAIAFSRGFYTAIAHGHSVDDATRSGRIAILGAPHTLEWVTPVLYVRGDSTQLFNVTEPARLTRAPDPGGPAVAPGGFPVGERACRRLRQTITRKPIASTVAVATTLVVTAAVTLTLWKLDGCGPPSNYQVVARIPFGPMNKPWGVAVDSSPGTHYVYVTDNEDRRVFVIDGSTRAKVAEVPVGNGPVGVAVNPATSARWGTSPSTVYVANSADSEDSLSVITVDAKTTPPTFETAHLPVGSHPVGVAVDQGPGTYYVYVTNNADEAVSVIAVDAKTTPPTFTQAPPVHVGPKPTAVAVDPETHMAYVANNGDNTVSVIQADTSVYPPTFKERKVTVGLHPDGVAVNPRTSEIYVANNGGDTVSVIQPGTFKEQKVTVKGGPVGVAVDGDANKVYVTSYDTGTVSVINGDTKELEDTVRDVGKNPGQVAVDPGTGAVYVANRGDQNVAVIQHR